MASNLFESIELDDIARRYVDASFKYADKIREAMKVTGMPLKTLATRVGVSETKLMRWLSGTHNWKLTQLLGIEAALNVDAPNFFSLV